MTTQYKFYPTHSRFTVQAFATGMLSFLGHDPVFTVRDFRGTVTFEDDLVSNMRAELIVRMNSLTVASEIKASDRHEIESRMQSEVLETATFPELTFQGRAARSERVTNGKYQVSLDGALTLHGRTRPYRMETEVLIFGDGIRLQGSTSLRMSEHGIRPVTALAGAIQLKDEVILSFDLGAGREAP